jgi:hypothetical protein
VIVTLLNIAVEVPTLIENHLPVVWGDVEGIKNFGIYAEDSYCETTFSPDSPEHNNVTI